MRENAETLTDTFRSDAYLSRLLWSIALLHTVLLVYAVFHYALLTPYYDDWELVGLLSKLYQHQLSWHDFWEQHNEHRLLFPRIIFLVCAQLSSYDLRWQMAVSLLLACGIGCLYAINIRRAASVLCDPRFTVITPLIILAVFSMRQQENWVWGWQVQIFLNIFAVVGCITVLTSRNLAWRHVILGMVCGIVATYSFANGLLIWLLGLILLWFSEVGSLRKMYICAWLLVSALVTASYFWDYHKPEAHPPLAYALKHPLQTLKYVFVYMDSGAMIDHHFTLSIFVGVAGVAAFILIGWQLVKTRRIERRVVLPYICCALYALLSAIVSAVGRVGFGYMQAAAGRYSTISLLFWVSLTVMIFLTIWQTDVERMESSASHPRRMRVYAALCLMGLVFLVSSLSYWPEYKARYLTLLPEQQRLLQSPDAPVPLLYPFPLQKRAEFLKQHQLALYR